MPAAAATRTATPTRKPRHTAPAAAARQVASMAFRGLDDWIDVFKAGTHTDAKGRTATFTADDLAQMAANVAGAGVPWVIGHPENEHRAWAWSKPGADVRVEGDRLQVRGSEIDAQFRALVDGGAFRERSVKVYNDPNKGWTLRHIGWLGAVPPAIQLAPLQYEAAVPAGAAEFEFMDADDLDVAWALDGIGQTLRGLRDWVISKGGLAEADQVLPDWRISSLTDTAARLRASALAEPDDDGSGADALAPLATAYTATPEGQTMPTPTLAEQLAAARAEGERAARAAVEAEFSAVNAATAAELQRLQRERQTERLTAQVGAWQREGFVTPALALGMVEFMAALEGGQAGEFAFNAADGQPAKKTPAAWFTEFMAARGKLVQLGHRKGAAENDDVAAAGFDPSDTRAIAKAAAEFRAAEEKAGRTVTVDQAVQHVMDAAGLSLTGARKG